MSDRMQPIPFGQLMTWILDEHKKENSIFGVDRLVRHQNGQALPIFAEKLEAPYGPAAGPNTQLAQNIIAAYAAGARFFELKTVQVMDGAELARCIAKPCIAAGDECYNCEWSTELTVPQAYEEYVKAWFACKLLARELGLGDPDGFVFNMSVGYDLAGIQSPKIDAYIEGMKDASGSAVFAECRAWALANVHRFAQVDAAYIEGITPHISASITESTLHGCPPAEIERIATYLIEQKGLNTCVKCNPTLLGYAFVRQRLDALGFGYVAFDDHHFREDMQWQDAVPMLCRLQKLGAEHGLEFGVKLTNTLPVNVTAGELPSQEMYLSGRALYPITIALARRVAEEFDGKMRISYSGGADFHNIGGLFAAGIWPITVATTILKPGGCRRLAQLGQTLMDCGSKPFSGVDAAAVAALDAAALTDPHYRKPRKTPPERKLGRKAPLLGCFTAPCRSGCPIGQDIPAYLAAVEQQRWADALNIILVRNALPFITGTVCPHHCTDSCMRKYYEEAVHIRAAKLQAAQNGYAAVLPTLKAAPARTDKKVAVVGGGPAGLSAASFLSRAGVPVTVFERSGMLGGAARNIPGLGAEAINHDIALCSAYGAKFELNSPVQSVAGLAKQGFTDVVLAVGTDRAAAKENAAAALLADCGAALDAGGRPVVEDRTLAVRGADGNSVRIYAAGDVRRGPATVVEAVADAAKVAAAIAGVSFTAAAKQNIAADPAPILAQRGRLCADCASCGKTRCLGCSTVCETCAEVCPNRANVVIQVPGLRQPQILHIDGMCNECGNCAVFCPYTSRPYRDKFTLFWSREDFDDSGNEGFLPTKKGVLVRLNGQTAEYDPAQADCGLPDGIRRLILAVENEHPYLIKS